MSEMRQDMVSKEWVIIAPGRAKRPDQNHKPAVPERPPLPRHRADCPFCAGNEGLTPGALLEFPGQGPWRVRVIPNKFAALSHEEECCHVWTGKFLRVGGYGSAEVVVESPRHDLSPALMPAADVAPILEAWRQRYQSLMDDPRNHLVTIFRNHGPRAGTSLEHPHSQIIATPVVPPNVRNQIDQALRSFDTYGTCLFCTMLEEERAERSRIVFETAHFTVFCPFASRSPYEVRIFPRRHACFYGAITEEEVADLAAVLRLAARQDPPAAREPGLQPHRALAPARVAREPALPLVHRDHPEALDPGGVRDRHRDLHQPDAPRGGGGGAAGRGAGGDGGVKASIPPAPLSQRGDLCGRPSSQRGRRDEGRAHRRHRQRQVHRRPDRSPRSARR